MLTLDIASDGEGGQLEVRKVVAKRMREARERAGQTQQELGESLEPLLGKRWTRQSVSAAEQGDRAFTAIDIVAIAYVTGVSPAYLLDLPPEADGLTLPTGGTLSREDLRQAAATGGHSAGVSALESALADLIRSTDEVRTRAAIVAAAGQDLARGSAAAP